MNVPLLVPKVLAVTEAAEGKSWADFPFSAMLGGDSSDVIPETWLHCQFPAHRCPPFRPVQVPKVHGPLTQSLLFWQKPHRQGGASSARRAGCIELYGFQHPVEGAKTAQAPRHWVHREYLSTGFCGGCAGMTGCSFSSLRLLDDLLLSAPRLDDHCPLFPPKARGNVSCSRSLISALKVS